MAYLDLAQKLGQSVERLNAGESVQTIVQINSLDEFKELFAADLSDAQRASQSEDLATRHADALAADPDTFPLARFANHIYGNAPLSEQDAQIAQATFPIKVSVVSQADMTITTDIVYGPSASPVLLNVGTLTFNGGSITTQNTVFTLNADILAFGSNSGDKPYHIGILGVDGQPGIAGAAGPAPNPAQAASGSNAKPRSPGVCTGVGRGGNGSNGAAGSSGGNGYTGQDGLPSLQATITIGGFSDKFSKLVLYTCSGAGGPGGAGGQGGAGQQGGNGGNGCDSGCEGTAGGDAGNGGNGGSGGNGAQGSNGVNGFNTIVTLPVANIQNVVSSSAVAPFGKGGLAGAGGQGGNAGTKGKGGKGSSDGKAGKQGDPGAVGTNGSVGTQQGSPGQFFIDGR